MHEIGIVRQVLRTVEEFAKENDITEVSEIVLDVGEVSQVNDDRTDNRFEPPVGRFPAIEEDEAPYRLLCTEYPR